MNPRNNQSIQRRQEKIRKKRNNKQIGQTENHFSNPVMWWGKLRSKVMFIHSFRKYSCILLCAKLCAGCWGYKTDLAYVIYTCYYKLYWYKRCVAHKLQIKYTILFIIKKKKTNSIQMILFNVNGENASIKRQ